MTHAHQDSSWPTKNAAVNSNGTHAAIPLLYIIVLSSFQALVPVTVDVDVPFDLHRYIIGQKGAGIRKMMEEYEVWRQYRHSGGLYVGNIACCVPLEMACMFSLEVLLMLSSNQLGCLWVRFEVWAVSAVIGLCDSLSLWFFILKVPSWYQVYCFVVTSSTAVREGTV